MSQSHHSLKGRIPVGSPHTWITGKLFTDMTFQILLDLMDQIMIIWGVCDKPIQSTAFSFVKCAWEQFILCQCESSDLAIPSVATAPQSHAAKRQKLQLLSRSQFRSTVSYSALPPMAVRCWLQLAHIQKAPTSPSKYKTNLFFLSMTHYGLNH